METNRLVVMAERSVARWITSAQRFEPLIPFFPFLSFLNPFFFKSFPFFISFPCHSVFAFLFPVAFPFFLLLFLFLLLLLLLLF